MNLGAFMNPEFPIFSTTLCYLERDVVAPTENNCQFRPNRCIMNKLKQFRIVKEKILC